MRRRRLRELGCQAKDVVLWTSLDADEARALAEAAGVELCYPGDRSRGRPHGVICAIHRAVHESEALAHSLDAWLEEMHADAVRAVEAREPEEVAEWLQGDLDRWPFPASGLAWALARDPRCAMRPVESWLLWRLQVEGLRALAFGKVEIIEVGS